MDRITRRSAYVSLTLHGALAAASLIAFGSPPPPPPPARIPSAGMPAAPPPAPADLAPLSIAAEDAVLAPAPQRLPGLTPGSPPLPPLPIVRATPTDRQGGERSRGGGGPDRRAAVDLPTAEGGSPALRAARSAHRNPALTHEQDMLATAQQFLDGSISRAYHRRWRGYATQISNRRLVVWVVVDQRRRVQRGGLYQCSTGSPELDRAIEGLLFEKDFGLPPIAPGVTTWFQVTLP